MSVPGRVTIISLPSNLTSMSMRKLITKKPRRLCSGFLCHAPRERARWGWAGGRARTSFLNSKPGSEVQKKAPAGPGLRWGKLETTGRSQSCRLARP